MAEFSKLVITEKGQALIAKMIAGSSEIEFTKVCASSTTYTEDALEALTALSNIKQSSLISKITRTNDVAIQVETSFTNTELTEGYYIKALGLYASDPDEGEILYAATIETSGNCYMPAYNNVTVSGVYVKLVTTVGNAESVSLEVDEAAVATIGDVAELRSVDDLLGEAVKKISVNGYDNSEFALNALMQLSGGLSEKVQIGDDVYAYICENGDCYVAGSGEIYDYNSSTTPFANSAFTSLYILNGVQNTGSYVFYHITSLTSVLLPNSVALLGSSIFQFCSSLSSIALSSNITVIPSAAFLQTALTALTIPDNVTTINAYAFRGCAALTSLSIPVGVTTINSTALLECTSLAYITVRGSSGDTDVPYGVCDSSSIDDSDYSSLTVDLNIDELNSDVVFMVIFNTAASNANGFKLTVNCNNGSTGSLYIEDSPESDSTITTLSANTPYYFYADDVDNGSFYLTSL